MNVTRSRISAIIALVTFPGIAPAQEPLSEADLRSAYCVPVLQWEIAQVQRGGDREVLEKLSSALTRVQAYLRPRMSQLDPTALAQAQNRARDDVQGLQTGLQCTVNCASKNPTETAAAACTKSCMDTAILARMGACEVASWVP